MIKKVFFCCFFLISNLLIGQEIIIIDKNNNPINNAAIFNKEKSIHVLSDLNGIVNLTRFSSNEEIYFQHPKYISKPELKNDLLKNKFWIVKEMLYEIEEVTLKHNQNTNNIKNSARKKRLKYTLLI